MHEKKSFKHYIIEKTLQTQNASKL